MESRANDLNMACFDLDSECTFIIITIKDFFLNFRQRKKCQLELLCWILQLQLISFMGKIHNLNFWMECWKINQTGFFLITGSALTSPGLTQHRVFYFVQDCCIMICMHFMEASSKLPLNNCKHYETCYQE